MNTQSYLVKGTLWWNAYHSKCTYCQGHTAECAVSVVVNADNVEAALREAERQECIRIIYANMDSDIENVRWDEDPLVELIPEAIGEHNMGA